MSAEAGGGVEVGAYSGGLSSTGRSGARRGLLPMAAYTRVSQRDNSVLFLSLATLEGI